MMPKTITSEQAQQCVAAAEWVIEKAASQCGLTRWQVARRYKRGRRRDAEVVTAVLTHAAAEAHEIDPDNLRAILEVILEFIKALMNIFS